MRNAAVVSLELCLRKTWAGKTLDNRDYIIVSKSSLFKMASVSAHENQNPAFSNSSCLESVFEKLRLGDGLAANLSLSSVV